MLGNDTLPALSADFTVDLFAFDSRLVELPSLNEVPAPGTQTRIDICPDCRSTWLDPGALEALLAHRPAGG